MARQTITNELTGSGRASQLTNEAIEQAETARRLYPKDAPERAMTEKFIRDMHSRMREDQEKSPHTGTEGDATQSNR